MTIQLPSGVKLTPKSDNIAEQYLRNMIGSFVVNEDEIVVNEDETDEEEKPQKTRTRKSAN